MMSERQVPHPPIASEEEWLAERKTLVEKEKALTRQKDAVNADRRRLPMVKVEKEYVFHGERGEVRLIDLFGGLRQLIVYHFMFDPEWDKGCSGCTEYVDELGDLSKLQERDTAFVLVSRAPLKKLLDYKSKRKWHLPWYSSFGSDFNYDYHVTMDRNIFPVEYNYLTEKELTRLGMSPGYTEGEQHGLSVFFRLERDVYHTYSSYARGNEGVTDAYALLDLTPYGRQESWEKSPKGWPQAVPYK